jgi:hypothetical protein
MNTTANQTIAEQISSVLGDGMTWRVDDENGNTVTFDDLVKRHDGQTVKRFGRSSDEFKALFPDRSVITACGGAWDIGYPECWCWQGNGHEDCTADTDA